MLKRIKKIRNYTALLKVKRAKQKQFKNHPLLVKQPQIMGEVKEEEEKVKQIVVEEPREAPCWNDSDDEKILQLPSKNALRKYQSSADMMAAEYEDKIARNYVKRFQKLDWAREGQDIEEKDVNDFLNEEVFYQNSSPIKNVIKFQARTQERHESIVSGLEWHRNIMFSCGLDHKVKVWSFHQNEENLDLKLRKEKDFYFPDLPLSNCCYRDNQLIVGTLRKNLAIVDCQKWTPSFITSTFLGEHKSYQNIRLSRKSGKIALFDRKRISILDKNNIYTGSMLANQQVEDFTFNDQNQYLVNAVTSDAIYEWDLRKFQATKLQKKYLGFTTIASNNHTLNTGSKLGTVYIYDANNLNSEPVENSNLLTHVSQLKYNTGGNLLVAASKWRTNAVRVIDVESGKSIGNWPNVQTKIGIPIQTCFSEWDHLGVGSSQGYISIFGFCEEVQ